MEQTRHRRATEIFLQVCDRPEAERAEVINALCADDSDLRHEVQALLTHADGPGINFEHVASAISDLVAAAANEIDRPELPKQIGPYRVVRELGEGGMGVVYLAVQDEPRRNVAIKLIRPGYVSAQLLRRFEHEAGFLARLQHPGIARIYGTGSTDDQRPYFVMEFVDGQPITSYCDTHRLTIQQRLELLIAVADAVHHAHMRGVIHRDLKPGNIIVADQDGQPWPRVIDFGVAKALHNEAADGSLLVTHATNPGGVLGTLSYMSPEQSRSSSDDVDVRSDVYALGIVLYELLIGCLPIEPSQLHSASAAERERMLWEQPTVVPSQRLRRLMGEDARLANEIAATRGVSPPELTRRIRGELDWIIKKCVAVDPDRRYHSVASLADDLRRYLRHEPIAARPDSRWYLFRKFIERNRVGTAATVIVVVALLAATVISTRFAIRAEHAAAAAILARDAETAQRQLVEQRETELEKVVEFQSSMFSDFDIDAMGLSVRQFMRDRLQERMTRTGRDPSEVDQALALLAMIWHEMPTTDLAKAVFDEHMLKRALRAIDSNFSEQPLVEAALRQTISDMYMAMGMAGAATPEIERAFDLHQRELGPHHEETLESQMRLASVLLTSMELDDAERMTRDLLNKRIAQHGPDDPDSIDVLRTLAFTLSRQGRAEEAHAVWDEVLERTVRHYGKEHSASINLLGEYGGFLFNAGQLGEAEQMLQHALAMQLRVDGPDAHNSLRMMNDLGVIELRLGRFHDAEISLRQAYLGRRQTLGSDHPHTIISMLNLANVLRRLNRADEALPLLREVVDVRERLDGTHDPGTLTAKNNLAVLLLTMGLLDEAEPLAVTTYERRYQLLGPEDPHTRQSLNTLAGVFQQQGRLDEAAATYQRLIDSSPHHTEHPENLRAMINLASVYFIQSRFEEAMDLQKNVVNHRSQSLGQDHPDTFHATRALIRTLQAMSRHDEARAQAEQLLEYLHTHHGPADPRTIAAEEILR